MQQFTPIFDEVCQHTGLVPAAIYGVVWRYCQMSNHVCSATLETIGRQAGVSKRTAIRALDLLQEQGWIVDTTPTYRNVPHVYQVTARLPQTRFSPPPVSPAVTDSHPSLPSNPSRVDAPSPPALPASPTRSDAPSPHAVPASHLNQTLQRDSLIDKSEIDQLPQEEEQAVNFPLWRQVLQILEYQFSGRCQYASWFPALRPLSFDGAVLRIAAPDTYQATLLNARLATTVSTILSGVLGRAGMTVTFVAEESRQSSVFSFQLSKEPDG